MAQTHRAAIVVLRVLIGWHFLYEGLSKLTDPRLVGRGLPAPVARAAFAPSSGAWRPTRRRSAIVNQLNMWGLTAIGLGLDARLLHAAGAAPRASW